MWIVDCSQSKVIQAELLVSTDAATLGRNFLGSFFFTVDELAAGNYTPSKHKLLNQNVINGIRSELVLNVSLTDIHIVYSLFIL